MPSVRDTRRALRRPRTVSSSAARQSMARHAGFAAMPSTRTVNATKAIRVLGGVIAMLTAGIALGPATSGAEEPATHRVTYTVTARTPVQADVYYRDTDPPSWADYSHNPYLFSPRATARIGPDSPWVLDVGLADPRQWAMVSATSGMDSTPADFGCELAVDGVVVASSEGPRGALCSLRNW